MKKFIVIFGLLTATAAHATTYLTDYVSAPFNSDHKILGTGYKGDILQALVVNVTTSASSEVRITDGASTVSNDLVVVPASAAVGSYYLKIGARSLVGGWRVTTRGGSSVVAVGSFR